MEVCVDSIESALAAWRGGAARLELCSSLSEGGLTPSIGLLKCLKSDKYAHFGRRTVFCLIRPRGGDFLYSEDEVEVMVEDVEALGAAGADGFVFGALTKEGDVDELSCAKVIAACKGKPMTFHRAIDMSRDLLQAARTISDLGFSRILTSGGQRSALEGKTTLKKLVEVSKKVTVMPGGGISEVNLEELLRETGCREFHASAREKAASRMEFRNEACSMGTESAEYSVLVTSEVKVKRMVKIFEDFTSTGN